MRATNSRARTLEHGFFYVLLFIGLSMLSQCGIVVMHLLGRLPLVWVRALGWLLGWVLYGLAIPRRRVAQTNLRLCFPEKSALQIRVLAMETFVHFAQAWLDRGWLW